MKSFKSDPETQYPDPNSVDECKIFESGLSAVLYARCTKHIVVPQQNKNEHGGAECGACIAEERDALKAKLANAQADSARLEWFEQACQGCVRGTAIPEWRIGGTSETDDDLRAVIDREAKQIGEHRDT